MNMGDKQPWVQFCHICMHHCCMILVKLLNFSEPQSSLPTPSVTQMSSVGNIYVLMGPPVTISVETRGASVSPCANKPIQKILFQQAFNEFSKFIGELKELHFRDWVMLCPTQPVSKPPAHVLPLCLFFLSEEATIPSPPVLHTFPLSSPTPTTNRAQMPNDQGISHKDSSVPRRNSPTSC